MSCGTMTLSLLEFSFGFVRIGQVNECPRYGRAIQEPLARLSKFVLHVFYQIPMTGDEAVSAGMVRFGSGGAREIDDFIRGIDELMRSLETEYCSKFTSSMSPVSEVFPAGCPQRLPAGGARFFQVLAMGSDGLYWKP